MEQLRVILNALLNIKGTLAALVVGRDGFVIEGVTADTTDVEVVGAVAASAMGSAEVMGNDLSRGGLTSILIEYESGPVAVAPAGQDALLVVVGDTQLNLGRARMEMRRVRTLVSDQV